MNTKRLTMDAATSRFWSAIFAAVTTVALVVGGIYSVVQYFDSRKKDRDSRDKDRLTYEFQAKVAEFEARKPFYSKQLDLCAEASSAAATLATSEDPKKKQVAQNEFWRLYWGPLGITEGGEVSGAMVSFGDCLNGRCGKPLKFLSLEIAHRCRQEISTNWDLKLPTVPNRPETSKSEE